MTVEQSGGCDPSIEELRVLFDRAKHFDAISLTMRGAAIALWAGLLALSEKMPSSPSLVAAASVALLFWFMESRVRYFYEPVKSRLSVLVRRLPAGSFGWPLESANGHARALDFGKYSAPWRQFFHWEQSLLYGGLVTIALALLDRSTGGWRLVGPICIVAAISICVWLGRRLAP